MALPPASSKSTLYCSFCGKSQHEVKKLIAGPTVFICDECVELCTDLITGEDSVSNYRGPEFSLNISKETLTRIEAMTFGSLESFFSTTNLSTVDGGPYTGAQIYKAVREVLHRNFKNRVREELRQSEIAAVQAQIDELEKSRDAEIEPLRQQLAAIKSGKPRHKPQAEPTPIKPQEA